MSFWSDAAARTTPIFQTIGGEPIIYTSVVNGQQQTPITTTAILLPNGIEQSSSPGYFADIEVDPALVTAPARGDLVQWADGTVYVVAQIAPKRPYSMFALAIHRQDDPTDEV